ncbi:MAG TPA: fibronectin type III domain-containing protein [Steroidobacteraceae bacterium]|jgi:hypothetical protein
MRDLGIGKWAARGALCALIALSLSGCNDDETTASTSTPPPAAPAPTPEPTLGTAKLEWRAPATYTNGAPLTNLAGYRIYYGTDVAQMKHTIEVSNPGVSSYVIEGLVPNTYYFAVTAVTNTGHESQRSNAGRKIIT